MSKLYIVSSFCVPESDLILLEFLLSLLEKQTGCYWQLANDMSGDIVIVDIDDPAGLKLHEKLVTEPDAPVIIVSSADKVESGFSLNKPMRSAEFIKLAKTIMEKYPDLGHEKVKADKPQQDTNATSNTKVDTAIKRPSRKRLYNLLTKDKRGFKNPVEISHRDVSLYVDCSSKQFFCEHRLMLLSILCKSDVDKLQIREVSTHEIQKIENEITGRPLSELTWCCALLGSSGELIDNIDEQTPLHLQHWPDLKSLMHLPRHITLAAFMSKHTATIKEIAEHTQVLPENIIDFINACYVLGYLDEDTGKKESKLPARDTDSIKQGLFGTIDDNTGESASEDTTKKKPHAVSSMGAFRKKILVIDDSLIARKAAADPLTEYGFDVSEAKDGFDALDKLEKDLPDLIILDLIMPGIDGYKVVGLLKGNEKYKHLPIIMVTSKDSLMDKLKGKMSPTDAYITKPFKEDDLLRTVVRIMKKS
ncbi:MAG: response regulator [Gammaproteobacteria bacterium]|nr:response regulator [Gammaproteobacteria bacterium]